MRLMDFVVIFAKMNDSTTQLTAADFKRLFEQFSSKFVTVARYYVRDNMVAQDIVTDSFMSLWENRERVEVTPNLAGYVLTTVKRRCLNWLRDQQSHSKAHQDIRTVAQRLAALRIATLEITDPNAVYETDIADIIEHKIKNMPEEMRNIFLASRHEDMSYAEIASRFNLSENQVKFTVTKALKILRGALKDYLPLAVILTLIK